MREDVTFYSVIGPFDTFGVYGLQAMTLSFTRDADQVVTDLSSQALLSYEHLYKTYYEREPLAPGAETSYYRFLAHEVGPKTHSRRSELGKSYSKGSLVDLLGVLLKFRIHSS